MSQELDLYRLEARKWLAEHAPVFAVEQRKGLSLDEEIAMARRWQALKADAGYAAITLPEKYGGAGLSEMHKIIYGEEEMLYDVLSNYFIISLSNALPTFLHYAQSEEQKCEIGPKAIRGEHVWCQMFSEPGAGSDLAAVRLKAERDGDDWVLNGQKVWTSWAQIADWGVVITRTDPTVPKHKGLTYFFVNMKTPGLEVRPLKRFTGDQDLNEVFFDNVRIPDSQRLGEVNAGFMVAIHTLMMERYAVSSVNAPLDRIIEIARTSKVGGRPALQESSIREVIADTFIEQQGLRSIHRRAVEAISAGGAPGPEGAIRKLLMGESLMRAGRVTLDLMGANGLQVQSGPGATENVAGSWLNAPVLRIAGGTDEVLKNTVAERILGLPQDYRPDKGRPFNELI
jgi:alkylation response protein AidB-like acyl-CoA dehydrogenase